MAGLEKRSFLKSFCEKFYPLLKMCGSNDERPERYSFDTQNGYSAVMSSSSTKNAAARNSQKKRKFSEMAILELEVDQASSSEVIDLTIESRPRARRRRNKKKSGPEIVNQVDPYKHLTSKEKEIVIGFRSPSKTASLNLNVSSSTTASGNSKVTSNNVFDHIKTTSHSSSKHNDEANTSKLKDPKRQKLNDHFHSSATPKSLNYISPPFKQTMKLQPAPQSVGKKSKPPMQPHPPVTHSTTPTTSLVSTASTPGEKVEQSLSRTSSKKKKRKKRAKEPFPLESSIEYLESLGGSYHNDSQSKPVYSSPCQIHTSNESVKTSSNESCLKPKSETSSLALQNTPNNKHNHVVIQILDSDYEDMDVDDDEVVQSLLTIREQTTNLNPGVAGSLSKTITTASVLNNAPRILIKNLVLVLDTNILIHSLRFFGFLLDVDLPTALCIKRAVQGAFEVYLALYAKGVCIAFFVQRADSFGRPLVLLPWMVILELDGLKSDNQRKKNFVMEPAVAFRARRASRLLQTLVTDRHPQLVCQKPTEVKEDIDMHIQCNDDRILHCCLQRKKRYKDDRVVLVTRDRNLCTKAIISDVESCSNTDLWKRLNIQPPSDLPEGSPVKIAKIDSIPGINKNMMHTPGLKPQTANPQNQRQSPEAISQMLCEPSPSHKTTQPQHALMQQNALPRRPNIPPPQFPPPSQQNALPRRPNIPPHQFPPPSQQNALPRKPNIPPPQFPPPSQQNALPRRPNIPPHQFPPPSQQNALPRRPNIPLLQFPPPSQQKARLNTPPPLLSSSQPAFPQQKAAPRKPNTPISLFSLPHLKAPPKDAPPLPSPSSSFSSSSSSQSVPPQMKAPPRKPNTPLSQFSLPHHHKVPPNDKPSLPSASPFSASQSALPQQKAPPRKPHVLPSQSSPHSQQKVDVNNQCPLPHQCPPLPQPEVAPNKQHPVPSQPSPHQHVTASKSSPLREADQPEREPSPEELQQVFDKFASVWNLTCQFRSLVNSVLESGENHPDYNQVPDHLTVFLNAISGFRRCLVECLGISPVMLTAPPVKAYFTRLQECMNDFYSQSGALVSDPVASLDTHQLIGFFKNVEARLTMNQGLDQIKEAIETLTGSLDTLIVPVCMAC